MLDPIAVDGAAKIDEAESQMYSAIACILIAGILLPPLYMFVMIQYGAITIPYWDHLATAKYIIQYLDGTLTFHTLIETQAQARPLFPRLIFIANAALTKWDIRSEYIYIYLTLYGVLAALLFALWRASGKVMTAPILVAALLISIIACSPVGAMNQYWSLMFLATLSYFCAIAALLIVSFRPLSRSANIWAAILAWVSAYSISQGLFVFPVLFFVHQMIAPKKFKLTRWSIFWLVNLVVCYAVYLPGVDLGGGQQHAIFDFFGFIPVYIGNPLGSLLWFPYRGSIDLPHTIVINGICGVVLLGLTLFTGWRALPDLFARRPEALIFYVFAAYTAACTIATAWGRAFGSYAIASANSSRYSIFAACLLFGLILYYAPKFARGELAFTVWHKVFAGIFLVASTVSYARAINVFKITHNDNEWLADVYVPNAEPTRLDSRAYPDPVYFNETRTALFRLGIGPYRSIGRPTAAIYSGPFIGGVPLKPGTIVRQRFKAANPVLRSMNFQIVTFGKLPSSYRVRWKVVRLHDRQSSTIGEGSFSAVDFLDWQVETVKLGGASDERDVEVTFSVDSGESVQNFIGLALYRPGNDPTDPVVVDGKAREDGGVVGLVVGYGDN